MTGVRFCFLSAVLAALVAIGSNKASADASKPPGKDIECVPIIFNPPKDEEIKRFIWKNYLSKYDDDYPTPQDWNERTDVAIIDLNGDGKDDVIFTRNDYCGSGGCLLIAIIRTGKKSGYLVRMSGVLEPICVERKKTDGLFNIIVDNGKRLKFNRWEKFYDFAN